MELIGYSDSNWGGDTDDRYPTTSYSFILGGGTTTWAAQKQWTVALTSTEPEYMALTGCSKHLQRTISFLQELSFFSMLNFLSIASATLPELKQ